MAFRNAFDAFKNDRKYRAAELIVHDSDGNNVAVGKESSIELIPLSSRYSHASLSSSVRDQGQGSGADAYASTSAAAQEDEDAQENQRGPFRFHNVQLSHLACEKRKDVWRKIVIFGSTGIVLVAVVVTALYFWNGAASVEVAMSKCLQQHKVYDDAHADYDSTYDSVKALGDLHRADVMDASTVTTMRTLLDQTVTTPTACTAETGVQSLEATTEELDQDTFYLEKGMKDLSRAARAVETSREEKIFRGSVDHAELLLERLGSEGASKEAMDALKAGVEKDEKLLDSEETKEFMVLQSAEERLETAMEKVADSLES
jgi:hypothetical protein